MHCFLISVFCQSVQWRHRKRHSFIFVAAVGVYIYVEERKKGCSPCKNRRGNLYITSISTRFAPDTLPEYRTQLFIDEKILHVRQSSTRLSLYLRRTYRRTRYNTDLPPRLISPRRTLIGQSTPDSDRHGQCVEIKTKLMPSNRCCCRTHNTRYSKDQTRWFGVCESKDVGWAMTKWRIHIE